MGLLTLTRHDKFECYSQVLEYMYYAQAVKLSHLDWVASLDMLNIFLNMLSIFLNMLSIFGIGFTLVLAILIISLV